MCRACGYDLSALSGHTCTECGADLRRVGVVEPSLIKLWPLIILTAMIWIILVWLGSWIFTPLIEDALFPTVNVLVQADRRIESSSGQFRYITIDGRGEVAPGDRSGISPPVSIIYIHFTPMESPYPLESCLAIEPQSMAMERQRFGWLRETVDAAPSSDPKSTFIEWCRDCGLDPEDPALQTELDAYWAVVTTANGGNMNSFAGALAQLRMASSGTSTANIGAPPWAETVLTWGWPALWLAGIVMLFLLIRRKPTHR